MSVWFLMRYIRAFPSIADMKLDTIPSRRQFLYVNGRRQKNKAFKGHYTCGFSVSPHFKTKISKKYSSLILQELSSNRVYFNDVHNQIMRVSNYEFLMWNNTETQDTSENIIHYRFLKPFAIFPTLELALFLLYNVNTNFNYLQVEIIAAVIYMKL